MNFRDHSTWLRLTALICAALLVPGDVRMYAQQPATGADGAKLKSPEQLDSLVAPLALYPDPLLAQVLAATTYPLEIVQCARWLKDNAKLTGENLTQAAAKQPWDPSVQALVAFPDALNLLDKNIQWTQDIGNAFLDQQSDVMDAIQRMRMKAKNGGKLQTSKEQVVEVKTIESKTIIEIQPSNPQVIYVPSYDPVVVYGAAPAYYAYPPVAYPYGYVAATAAISFGVGVAMGAFWGGCCGGGGWGWNAGWSNNNININNNFNSRYGYNNINGGNRNQINGGNRANVGGGNSNWQHNPAHRRATPYGSSSTAQRFNGTARNTAGQTQRFDGRTGAADRGNVGDRGGTSDRSGANRAQSGSRGSGGGDRIGNRSIDSSNRSNSALGNSGSRDRSQASSNRGFSSTRSSGGFGGGGGGGARSSGRTGGGRRR